MKKEMYLEGWIDVNNMDIPPIVPKDYKGSSIVREPIETSTWKLDEKTYKLFREESTITLQPGKIETCDEEETLYLNL